MLGHLHGPQWAEQGRVRYAGSLLKYSFSEWKHVKGVDLVELGAQDVKVEQIPITPRRDLVKIEGYLDALISEPRLDMKDDYLLARLHDEGPLIDPMARLKTVYPNVLALERSSRPQSERTAELLGDHRRRSHSELFSAFYNYVWDAPPDKDQQAAFQNVLETLQIREREADEAAEA
jgi:exonuclease SbcD